MGIIYLDCAATTRPCKEATEAFNSAPWLNPSATLYDSSSKIAIETARKDVASQLGCSTDQIFFTSGSTEAANWVISSAVNAGDHIITDLLEHPCVYESAFHAQSRGVYVHFIKNEGCRLDLGSLDYLLKYCTARGRKVLVAIMSANNELGSEFRPSLIAEIVSYYENASFFCDMTQLQQPLDGIDFACMSAHKFGGYKGTGVCFARQPEELVPLLYGGHQEANHRAGTENVGGICAMAAAMKARTPLGYELRDYIEELARQSGMTVNGGDHVVPNIVSLTLPDCKAQDMVVALAMDGIYISAGSACNTGTAEPSRVLLNAGLTADEALRAVRISFDRNNTEAEIDELFERMNYYRKVLGK
jgi:cysteine desulfurase